MSSSHKQYKDFSRKYRDKRNARSDESETEEILNAIKLHKRNFARENVKSRNDKYKSRQSSDHHYKVKSGDDSEKQYLKKSDRSSSHHSDDEREKYHRNPRDKSPRSYYSGEDQERRANDRSRSYRGSDRFKSDRGAYEKRMYRKREDDRSPSEDESPVHSKKPVTRMYHERKDSKSDSMRKIQWSSHCDRTDRAYDSKRAQREQQHREENERDNGRFRHRERSRSKERFRYERNRERPNWKSGRSRSLSRENSRSNRRVPFTSSSSKTEAIYLPFCKDVDSELLKEKLEQFLSVVERKTGMRPIFHLDDKGKHHFMIRCEPFEKYKKAKSMVIDHVHQTLTELRSSSRQFSHYPKEHAEWDISSAGEISGPFVVEAVMSGLLLFFIHLPEYASEKSVLCAIETEFGSLPELHSVAFEGYKSHEEMGIAIFKVSCEMDLETIFSFPPVRVRGAEITMLDMNLLDSCFDVASKRRIARMLDEKSRVGRAPGCFPQGAQPNKVVIVVDNEVPYLRKQDVKKSVSKIISGSRLDVTSFYNLIFKDVTFGDDNILYIVVPWLDFFLKGIKMTPPPTSSVRASTKISMEDYISNTNIPREFCYNFLTQCDFSDTASFVGNLDPTLPENIVLLKTVGALSRRMIHSAQTLRTAVTSRSLNSEVIFCGYPTSWITTSNAQESIREMVPEKDLSHFAEVLKGSLELFNSFASNTWKLGGFTSPSLNDLKLLQTEKDLGEEGEIDSDSNDEKQNEEDEEKSEYDNGDSKDLMPRIDKCGSFYVDFMTNLKWIKIKQSNSKKSKKSSELIKKEELSDREEINQENFSRDDQCEVAVKENVALSYTYTNEVKKALQGIKTIWKGKSSFPPWTAVESEKIDPNSLPEVVSLSLEHYVYKEKWNDKEQKTHYECTKCNSSSGDIVWAESHAYERKHVKNITKHKSSSSKKDISVLLGNIKDSDNNGLSHNFLKRMEDAKIISIKSKSSGKRERYECLLCNDTFNKTGLRFHVNDATHKSNLIASLNLPQKSLTVNIVENWSTVKKFYRHPAMDAIVIIADECFYHILKPIERAHSKVYVYCVPDLVMDENSQEEALMRWTADRRLIAHEEEEELDDIHALVVVVTGIDLFLKPRVCNLQHLEAPLVSTSTFIPSQHSTENGDRPKDVSAMPNSAGDSISDCMTQYNSLKESQENKQNDGQEFEKIIDMTPVPAEKLPKLIEHSERKCCGAQYYDVAKQTSFNILQNLNVDKAVDTLVDIQSYVRNRIPLESSVLMMPVMPLNILFDSLPREVRKPQICTQQSIILSEDQVNAVQIAYNTLFDKSYMFYECVAERENYLKVEKRAMAEANVHISKYPEDSQWMNFSSWRAVLETHISSALFGMSSVYSKKKRRDISKDIVPSLHTSTCAVVGQPMVFPDNEYTFTNLHNIHQKVSFRQEEVRYVFDHLAARVCYDRSVTWTCYLVSYFPSCLFTQTIFPRCLEEKCQFPIKCWVYDRANSVQKRLDRVASFLAHLSYKLGPGHVPTLFPVYPKVMVSFENEGEIETHTDLHRAMMRNPQACFTPEPYRDVLTPVVKEFNDGMREIFNATRVTAPIGVDDDREQFSFVKAVPLMKNVDTSASKIDIKEWVTTVNTILQATHPQMKVKVCDKENAGTGANMQQTYNNVAMNYDGENPGADNMNNPNGGNMQQQQNLSARGRGVPFNGRGAFSNNMPRPMFGGPNNMRGNFRGRFQRGGMNRFGPPNPGGPPGDPSQMMPGPPFGQFAPVGAIDQEADFFNSSPPKSKKKKKKHRRSRKDSSSSSSDSSALSDRSDVVPVKNPERKSLGFNRSEFVPLDNKEKKKKKKHRRARSSSDSSSDEDSEEGRSRRKKRRKKSSRKRSSSGSRSSSNKRSKSRGIDKESVVRYPLAKMYPVDAVLDTASKKEEYEEGEITNDDKDDGSFVLKVFSGQNPLHEMWMVKLLQEFHLDPYKKEKTSDEAWKVVLHDGALANFFQEHLNGCRLIDKQLTVVLSEYEGQLSTSSDYPMFKRTLDKFKSEYNESVGSHIQMAVSRDCNRSFFSIDWQDVYCVNLSNTYLVAANALRSISGNLRQSNSTRLLVISPDVEAVRFLGSQLQSLAANLSLKMSILTGESDHKFDLASDVVIGTLHHICDIEKKLLLQQLKAIILDNAAVLACGALQAILLKQLVNHIKWSTPNYRSINKVAVANVLRDHEKAKTEQIMECDFTRSSVTEKASMTMALEMEKPFDPPVRSNPLPPINLPPPALHMQFTRPPPPINAINQPMQHQPMQHQAMPHQPMTHQPMVHQPPIRPQQPPIREHRPHASYQPPPNPHFPPGHAGPPPNVMDWEGGFNGRSFNEPNEDMRRPNEDMRSWYGDGMRGHHR